MDQIHIAITRQVKPGKEVEFEIALREFAKRSLHVEGTTGVHLIGPSPASDSNDYGILRSFESEAASKTFYESDLYHEWEEKVAPLVAAAPIKRRLHGLEIFFRDNGYPPPAQWKMAVVTWLGVFPTVWLWSWLLPGFLPGIHPIAVMAIVDVFVVITLAWFAMPLLTKMFDRWLYQPIGSVEEL